ncbi:hypothetical protein [Lacticaseibacillus zhaodongensis]|uniref:hypothetical protein n=1 Tax=Lacticaseibacillus zhaodongensis TaxID=2668065 RepID=UPI0012D34EEF|nr:hypothetical protein [Lacticaseibacillus zhaodongensis]
MSLIVYWPIVAAVAAAIGVVLIAVGIRVHIPMPWKIVLIVLGVVMLGAGLRYFIYLWG